MQYSFLFFRTLFLSRRPFQSPPFDHTTCLSQSDPVAQLVQLHDETPRGDDSNHQTREARLSVQQFPFAAPLNDPAISSYATSDEQTLVPEWSLTRGELSSYFPISYSLSESADPPN